jgi:hypothetical protein
MTAKSAGQPDTAARSPRLTAVIALAQPRQATRNACVQIEPSLRAYVVTESDVGVLVHWRGKIR